MGSAGRRSSTDPAPTGPDGGHDARPARWLRAGQRIQKGIFVSGAERWRPTVDALEDLGHRYLNGELTEGEFATRKVKLLGNLKRKVLLAGLPSRVD